MIPFWFKIVTIIIKGGMNMFERVVKNLKTTAAAVIPAIVAVGAWWGFDVDPDVLTKIVAAIYAILLLFSKDRPQE